ncbi:nitric oxide synthase [Microbacterium sp. ANT_H45B]|uniref:flavodoxin domain-containing protein n=1 Tax=Microbacterium sp. ANT_H45B TaxID=2597346 RepID=UPI0011EC7652|nr:flavodoxin domain-containing protein [Microbacterium sp. ANT_H45B]KAA0962499.1 nitric oxide synthase [Microbacterium sp. ANT_H45B]
MKICILYGTESGNSELVATDLFESLEDDHDVVLEDLADVDVASLEPATLHLVICSTHGEGDPPQSALPFLEGVKTARVDLTGIRYAMFGLGDSTYVNYSRGSEHVDELLAGSGAERVGEYGRHDAASRDDASALAEEWARNVLETVPDLESASL